MEKMDFSITELWFGTFYFPFYLQIMSYLILIYIKGCIYMLVNFYCCSGIREPSLSTKYWYFNKLNHNDYAYCHNVVLTLAANNFFTISYKAHHHFLFFFILSVMISINSLKYYSTHFSLMFLFTSSFNKL